MRELLISNIANEYGLGVKELLPLNLGGDIKASVYGVRTTDEKSYFLKQRQKASFHERSVSLPYFLHESEGIGEVVAPLPTKTGALFTDILDSYLILYPFIAGQNGWEKAMSEKQWKLFGQVLHNIHQIFVPDALKKSLVTESYSSSFRQKLSSYLLEEISFIDAADRNRTSFAKILVGHKELLTQIIDQAEKLAIILRNRTEKNYVLTEASCGQNF